MELKRTSVERQAHPTKRIDNGPRWRILIIDDAVATCEMYSMLLQKRGHEVETAPDGNTGLSMVEKFRPDVVLLDIGMSGLNGFETCKHIREMPSGKNLLVIAVTGWPKYEVAQRARQSGFNEVLVKPLLVEDLLKCVTELSAAK
jgi:CheY-like chemotaxis protein